ncbi:serine protease inhibitor 77Ba-like [Drosophila santomea]|uniref:serine protease inhibitor 77Ba-like n=1 Tax=Drosophila santomea TaxID=129105 RepID=UPI001CCB2881|nr:serine protease inhibitor 77Ba-like [Drosophila santomea]
MKLGFLVLLGNVLSLLAHDCGNNSATTTTMMTPTDHLADAEAQIQNMTTRMQHFGFNLMQVELGKSNLNNFVMAPFSVWSLMLVFHEAAVGETFDELQDALGIYVEYPELREWYTAVRVFHRSETNDSSIHSMRYVYYDKKNIEFVRGYYSIVLEGDPQNAYDMLYLIDILGRPGAVNLQSSTTINKINEDVRLGTSNFINSSYTTRSFTYSNPLLAISANYFNAKWRFSFDKSQTKVEQFYNDAGSPAGKVHMMVQTGKFAYAKNVKDLQADVLELPFYEGDLVMIVILPNRGNGVGLMLSNLKALGLQPILRELEASKNESEVEVKLPRIDTNSRFELRHSLPAVGIKDLEHSYRANISRMLISAYDIRKVFLSNCDHYARIVVNEEGAVAQKSSGKKNIKAQFHMNRPFIYLVLKRSYNLLIHAGVFQKGEIK